MKAIYKGKEYNIIKLEAHQLKPGDLIQVGQEMYEILRPEGTGWYWRRHDHLGPEGWRSFDFLRGLMLLAPVLRREPLKLILEVTAGQDRNTIRHAASLEISNSNLVLNEKYRVTIEEI